MILMTCVTAGVQEARRKFNLASMISRKITYNLALQVALDHSARYAPGRYD